jgi:hypothetical protein
MKIFTVENETNNITVHASVQEARLVANAKRFRSEAAFARLAADWPTSRLVDIWNGLRGVNQITRFKDRPTAVSRIWKAIRIRYVSTRETAKKTPGIAGAPGEGSKASQVIAMLRRKDGTTLEEIMSAMGWQKHTARAMMSAGGSLTKKHGLVITSQKVDDQRKYSVKP